VWAEGGVEEGVLAFFEPTKPVPKFKFAGAGKTEIIRKFQGDKPRFYQGIAQFFKLAKEYGGNCLLFSPSVGVFLRDESGNITKFVPGEEQPMQSVIGMTAVVALAGTNTSVEAGVTMTKELFLRIGVNEGWGLAL